MSQEQSRRIAALQDTYQAKFEAALSGATSIKNYEYLDVLERGFTAGGLVRPEGGVVCDSGCANFRYAAAMPNARFEVSDYLNVRLRADVITAWARRRARGSCAVQ